MRNEEEIRAKIIEVQKGKVVYKKITFNAYGNSHALEFEGQEVTCNSKPTGRYGGFLNYFDCSKCKNQNIGEDDLCNDIKDVYDTTDSKRYCLNYEE